MQSMLQQPWPAGTPCYLLQILVCFCSFLRDRKSTRLNSSHTVIYTLSLHDALPISVVTSEPNAKYAPTTLACRNSLLFITNSCMLLLLFARSEEHTSELQSHSDLHSFPTRRSSDLCSYLRAKCKVCSNNLGLQELLAIYYKFLYAFAPFC